MARRSFTITLLSEQVAKDLAQKLVQFPELPWILVNRIALEFRSQGRNQAFGKTSPTTLGDADPWTNKSRSRYKGQSRERSFIYSTKQTKKNAIANLGHPLANIWESATFGPKRKVKRQIPFLSAFAAKFEGREIGTRIAETALENIAKGGKP